MRRIILALIAACFISGPSFAQNSLVGELSLLGDRGAPSWVKRANGLLPFVYFDFYNNRAWSPRTGITAPFKILTYTGASVHTDLYSTSPSGAAFTQFASGVPPISQSAGGLIIEKSITNLLLNSLTPATQTTGSLANGTYTLTAYAGSGSLTMSAGTGTGCGTGVATLGSPVSFTITSPGTCTVTLAGSLECEQLELGAYSTSCMPTAGAAAARADDLAQLAIASGAFSSDQINDPVGMYAVVKWPVALPSGNFPSIAVLASNTQNNASLYLKTQDGSRHIAITVASVSQCDAAAVIGYTYNTFSQWSGTFQTGYCTGVSDGVQTALTTSNTMPTGMTSLTFGGRTSVENFAAFVVKEFGLYAGGIPLGAQFQMEK